MDFAFAPALFCYSRVLLKGHITALGSLSHCSGVILLLRSSAPNPPDMCNCAKVLRAAADDTAATRLLVPQQLKSCKAAAMGASWGGCQPLVGALT